MHTIETLARFRAVLAEYDIVATGLKTVCRGLQRIVDPRAETLFGKLQSLEKHFSLTREPLWQAQVSDENLSLLLAALHAGAAEADPIAPLSQTLHSLKAILSPLANTAECKLQDALPENPAPAAPAAENSRAENLDLMAYSVGFGLPTLASTPYRVILDTTSRCNLRCLTCYQSATQDTIHYDLADSPIETLEPALRQAGYVFVAGMGETLLSRSAIQAIAAGRAGGAQINAITNGTSPARLREAVAHVDMLMVSFDGGTPETFEAIRRYASFHKVVAGIAELGADERRKICFNVTVCKQNVFSMGACIDLAISLGIGHVHFQAMQPYLGWHHLMALEKPEIDWFFRRYPGWSRKAAEAGVDLVCNLVRSTGWRPFRRVDAEAETRRNLAAVAATPIAPMPPRREFADSIAEIDTLLADEPPAIFRAIADAVRPARAEPAASPASCPPDWAALRAHVENGRAKFPHCLSTFAHLVVNGDGTTRSCCKVQNRLADIDADQFADIWNAAPYVALRTAHAGQIAPRAACVDCRDPVRFHFLPEILETLESHGIDVGKISRPRDFPVPDSSASHSLVQKLGRHP